MLTGRIINNPHGQELGACGAQGHRGRAILVKPRRLQQRIAKRFPPLKGNLRCVCLEIRLRGWGTSRVLGPLIQGSQDAYEGAMRDRDLT